ncbi:MAG TPA: DUF1015 domain-containing protein [Patescibacteria group bacterium]|nr:DUF1015 domain-containing protein [Patescibacteria group bacterium]
MAEIFPFHAWRYDSRRVRLADVVTQPYDKITPEMQERYLAADPFYNFIRIEKGPATADDSAGNNVYTRAKLSLGNWIREGVLRRDREPAIYPYFQEYTVPGTGLRRTRKGFITLGRLEDYSAGVIFRHEHTLPGPKADRLELLRQTRTQTGLLFMLYQDPERATDRLIDEAAESEPVAEATDELGVTHRLWMLSDPAAVAALAGMIAPKRLLIADGHHRYETALAFRNECRQASGRSDPAAPHERAMMALFNADGEGLTILPTHRLVFGIPDFAFDAFRRRIEPQFDCRSYPFASASEREGALDEFRRELERQASTRTAIGAYAGGGAFHLFLLRDDAGAAGRLADLTPAERQLDVVLLHRVMLEGGLGITPNDVSGEKRVGYERQLESALSAVDAGRAQLALLLNPARIELVAQTAFAGRVLPEKSTDFYPKLLSGLTLYRLDD